MTMTTTKHVENWMHARGGLATGLPRLRNRVKAGLLSSSEVAVVKEYLANLDPGALSRAVLPAAGSKKSGNTAVVVAIMVAAFAAALVAVR